ncbi:MAG TPA: acetate/propionate family kinase [Geminicoccus sp.]|uniref:acetate/propionate family kinase n=1 Tax=Geminicoccus sp. TaxID=2024832 RepID=UPI002CAAEDD9|nr:acetate/propionate family kinase [Geminicoccus sp.]HWL71431.1 acetate/propionate family kinase [Geminicoccus sp.]
MTGSLLVLNTGSSSIKFQVFALGRDGPERRLKGLLDGIRVHPHLEVKDEAGTVLLDKDLGDHAENVGAAVEHVLTFLQDALDDGGLVAIGHRVVHGGRRFEGPARITAETLAEIEALVPLAPLHQPNSIAPIRTIQALRPDLPQVACFDTVFHRGHAELADRFAIPEALDREGVRRYGFHGLSYAFIAERLRELDPELAGGRVVAAHLGSGASLCAIQEGRSIETTMGFTALDGLPMGTRPGRLDAGVILYLMQQGWDAKKIERMLYHECGLLGLSGVSNDVRELKASQDPRAGFALDYFAHRIAQETALLATSMGGIDGFVFTAGIGERSASIRANVAKRLAWLGMALDDEANGADAPLISSTDSRIVVRVIPTDEEAMIARQTLKVLDLG